MKTLTRALVFPSLACLASAGGRAAGAAKKNTFVIVHGATAGGWLRAKSRGWTTRVFPGHHVAHVENPRGVATLVDEAVNDKNQPVEESPAAAIAK